jgi:hypothetical protein
MTDTATLLPTDSPARCLGCRYPLRGLTVNRCPECGREFDPDVPETMLVPVVPGPGVEYLRKPPGLAFLWSVTTISVVILLANGFLAMRFPFLESCGSCCLCLFAAVWLMRALLWAAIGAADELEQVCTRRHTLRRWLTAPIVLLLTLILVSFNIPLKITFQLSRPAMERVAQEAVLWPMKTRDDSYRRIGLYLTDCVWREEDGVGFMIVPAFPFTTQTFRYSPDGPPHNMGRRRYVQFCGPWYLSVASGGG